MLFVSYPVLGHEHSSMVKFILKTQVVRKGKLAHAIKTAKIAS